MAALNYAESYARELANAYGQSLYFGRLWSTPNQSSYRVIDAKTIQLPLLSTGGRINGSRDEVTGFTRNFDNDWETKTLSHHREWNTLVHPKDVIETNHITTIANITRTMNETQKFPEMDAFTISELFKAKTDVKDDVIDETLTTDNVLTIFDKLMDEMDEALVPLAGRLLYVDTYTKTLLDNAIAVQRQNGQANISRNVSRIDEVEILPVPTRMMKSKYTFDKGYAVASDAKDIAMFLCHTSAILPIASYEFAQLESPSASSKGKYLYFEESFEDIFILNKRHDALRFVTKKVVTP